MRQDLLLKKGLVALKLGSARLLFLFFYFFIFYFFFYLFLVLKLLNAFKLTEKALKIANRKGMHFDSSSRSFIASKALKQKFLLLN